MVTGIILTAFLPRQPHRGRFSRLRRAFAAALSRPLALPGLAPILLASIMLAACEGEIEEPIDEPDAPNAGNPPAVELVPPDDRPPSAPPLDEQSLRTSLDAAAQYLDAGSYDEADAILARLRSRAPDRWEVYELAGRVAAARSMHARQRFEIDLADAAALRAFEQYEQAVRLAPDNAGLLTSAGMIALMADRPDRALEHFDAAAKLDPSNPQPPLYAAQIDLQAGRLESAAGRLDRVLELEPDLPTAIATLAVVELRRGETDKAIGLADRALRLEPENLDLRIQAAKIRRQAGRPRAALELLVGLSAAQRRHTAVLYELAAAYADAGMPQPALDSWTALFSGAPNAAIAAESAARAGLAAVELGDRALAATWRDRARDALNRIPPDTSTERGISAARADAERWLDRLNEQIAAGVERDDGQANQPPEGGSADAGGGSAFWWADVPRAVYSRCAGPFGEGPASNLRPASAQASPSVSALPSSASRRAFASAPRRQARRTAIEATTTRKIVSRLATMPKRAHPRTSEDRSGVAPAAAASPPIVHSISSRIAARLSRPVRVRTSTEPPAAQPLPIIQSSSPPVRTNDSTGEVNRNAPAQVHVMGLTPPFPLMVATPVGQGVWRLSRCHQAALRFVPSLSSPANRTLRRGPADLGRPVTD